MAPNLDTDERFLKELLQINEGLRYPFFVPLIDFHNNKQNEAKFQDIYTKMKALGIVQPYDEVLPKLHAQAQIRIPRKSLEMAVADLQNLKTEAENSRCSDYVTQAIGLFGKVITALPLVDTALLTEPKIFDSLNSLSGACLIEGPFYMTSDRVNKCRGPQYKAAQVLDDVGETLELIKAVGDNEEAIKKAEGVVTALTAYLDICKQCPFREYHKQKTRVNPTEAKS